MRRHKNVNNVIYVVTFGHRKSLKCLLKINVKTLLISGITLANCAVVERRERQRVLGFICQLLGGNGGVFCVGGRGR